MKDINSSTYIRHFNDTAPRPSLPSKNNMYTSRTSTDLLGHNTPRPALVPAHYILFLK